MQLTFDDLAAFLRRERNSLHYKTNAERSRQRPGDGGEYMQGYSTAIDGVTARLIREFRDTPGFDTSRFLAMVEGRFSADDVFDESGKRLGSRSEVFGS